MKILLLSMNAYSLINFRGRLIKSLISRNHIVHVTAPICEIDKAILKKINNMGAKYVPMRADRTSLNLFSNLIILYEILKILLKYKYDLVFSYTIKPVIFSGISTQILSIFYRKKIQHVAFITGLGYAFTEGKAILKRFFIRKLLIIFYKISLMKTRSVVFQNPDDKLFFLENNLLAKNVKIDMVAGSGVNLSFFKKTKLPKKQVFLMLARLIEDKGIKEYISSAKLIKSKNPNIVFRLAGIRDRGPTAISDDYFNKVINDGHIEYLGVLDPKQVRSNLMLCRYYVLPSYREGMPRSVLGAIAIGRPVITTDVPGCRETVIHGVNGFLVKPRSVKSLAYFMNKIINLTDAEILLMAKNSISLAKNKFSDIKVNRKIIQIIEYQDSQKKFIK